jgi:hypothetical protein
MRGILKQGSARAGLQASTDFMSETEVVHVLFILNHHQPSQKSRYIVILLSPLAATDVQRGIVRYCMSTATVSGLLLAACADTPNGSETARVSLGEQKWCMCVFEVTRVREEVHTFLSYVVPVRIPVCSCAISKTVNIYGLVLGREQGGFAPTADGWVLYCCHMLQLCHGSCHGMGA